MPVFALRTVLFPQTNKESLFILKTPLDAKNVTVGLAKIFTVMVSLGTIVHPVV